MYDPCPREVRIVSVDSQSWDLVITKGAGYKHLTREYLPLVKASAIGASSGEILEDNVQTGGQRPQLVHPYMLVVKSKGVSDS